MNEFNQATLSAAARRNAFIAGVHYFDTVGSTNTIACRLAIDGAGEGDVVIADAQTQGRGRLERRWQSPAGRNIYMSLILRPAIEPAAAPQLTLMAGLAVAELFSEHCAGMVSIKWPNDILICGKKTCGILTEMKAAAGGVDFVILGMGLNINMQPDEFDPDLRGAATSLAIETAKHHDRIEIIFGLFCLIEKWYKVFLAQGFPGLREYWLAYADLLGRRIKVVFKDQEQTGFVADIDTDGTIIMRDEKGAVSRVIAGDIHILRG